MIIIELLYGQFWYTYNILIYILKNHIIIKKYWNVSPNCVEYILYYINIFQNTSPIRKDIPINQYTYSKLLKE